MNIFTSIVSKLVVLVMVPLVALMSAAGLGSNANGKNTAQRSTPRS